MVRQNNTVISSMNVLLFFIIYYKEEVEKKQILDARAKFLDKIFGILLLGRVRGETRCREKILFFTGSKNRKMKKRESKTLVSRGVLVVSGKFSGTPGKTRPGGKVGGKQLRTTAHHNAHIRY